MLATETIFALSTAAGIGGVAVIRVSGPLAFESLQQITRGAALPVVRQCCVRRLWGSDGVMLDQAMIVRFAGPASFTGQDVVEYHVHGGRAVVQGVIDFLIRQPQHRMAMAGEFTRRAFENGKMDLTEAEAVADLIHAETEAQRSQALHQMEGRLGAVYEAWKDRLARLLALMEADLDFSDQDLPEDILLQMRPDVSDLIHEIELHLNDNRRGERLRDGFRIVILGAPNAGKSTLLNMLAMRDVAIVSPIAGTTRDVIETHLDIGGYPVIVADTAGLRAGLHAPHDVIEGEGIKRAVNRAQDADIKILLFDAAEAQDADTLAFADDAAIIVLNKQDLVAVHGTAMTQQGISISALTGAGMDTLLQEITCRLQQLAGPRDMPALTRVRHRDALQRALACLRRATDAVLPELMAEDLRLAIRAIGSITGYVDVEDLLDIIFRDFCIGK